MAVILERDILRKDLHQLETELMYERHMAELMGEHNPCTLLETVSNVLRETRPPLSVTVSELPVHLLTASERIKYSSVLLREALQSFD